MIRTWTRIALYFILLVLLQALVLNRIQVFGFMSPFVYVYVIMKLPVDLNRMADVAIAFLLGLTIDIFSNTYGMHAAACTLTGFLRRPLSERLLDLSEIPEGSIPSFTLFGYAKFMRYALFLTTIDITALFMIEAFGAYQTIGMIIKLISSVLFTCLLIFIIEAFNISKANNG